MIILFFAGIFAEAVQPGISRHILGVQKVDPGTNINIKKQGLYYETKWDPLLESKTSLKNYQNVLEMQGQYENHEVSSPPAERYGDVSILTLNLASETSTVQMNQEITIYLKEVLDHAHPAIFALQGVREPLLARLKKLMNDHYVMLNEDSFTKDALSAAHYFVPIIIDRQMLHSVKTGYFQNQKGQIYASYAVLDDKRRRKKLTVINMDLYSTFKGMVEGQFANILSDIKGEPSIGEQPILFAGGIGSLSQEIKKLLRSGYKNLIDHDPNNSELDLTTVHGKVEHSDNIERDFVILRDPRGKMETNYARILSRDFKVGEHYPVHAILSYVG